MKLTRPPILVNSKPVNQQLNDIRMYLFKMVDELEYAISTIENNLSEIKEGLGDKEEI